MESNIPSQPDPLHEVEARLGNLAVRLEEHDKRLADHRAYFTALSSIVGIVFTIVVASGSLIGYLQFSNEKAALESFKQQVLEDVEQRLGKAKDSSEIEILTATREPIEAPIPAIFREGNPEIKFAVAFRNRGKSIATMTVVKIYTKDPLAQGKPGRSDEANYPYEFSYRKEHPDKLFFSVLPPGEADDMFFWFRVDPHFQFGV